MLIDAHTHLDMFGEALPAALNEIKQQQIFTLSVSIDVDSYKRTKTIAAENPLIVPLFGIHPWEAHRFADNLDSLTPFMAESPMLGEIGLDFFFMTDKSLYPKQFAVFDAFLDTAVSQQKIVNIHAKGAETAVLERLEQFRPPNPIVHWYSGPIELIDRYLAVDTYFSIGVGLLYAKQIEQILTAIPANRLLSETDNPDAYQHFAHQPGSPSLIHAVVNKISQQKKLPSDELVALIGQNFERLLATAVPIAKQWNACQQT